MKQTEIGLIPEDWEVKSLGEIGEPCMCKRILKEQTSPTGDIPFYKIGTFGGIPDAFISRDLFEQYKEQYNYPRKGTLLLSAAGTIGRVVVFDCKESYFQDSNIVWIDNDETKVTNAFLFYCYSRMQWKTEEGGIVSRLYNANLKATSFIAPKSLAEQQQIAKALSDVDALISTTEKLIQKKKNIKQGTMQNLLTGKKRLPGFALQTKSPTYKQTELGLIPEDWEVKSLGEMLKIGHGKDYKNLKSGNVPVYGTGGYMTSVNDFLYEGETVCIGRKGTIDKPQYHSGKIWTVDTLFYTYDFKSLNPKYLFYKFCLIDWLSMNEASGVPSLTAKNIEDIQIAIPTVEEQTAIANVLSSMDKEIETLNTKLEKYRNLKTAMMQQLLTGKIRLIK